MNILFRKRIGFLYDVCAVIICKSNNRDVWMDAFVRDGYGNDEKDVIEIEKYLEYFEEIPPIDIFGYKQKNDSAFITSLFMEFLRLYCNNCTINNFVDFVFDEEKLKRKIMEFYLQNAWDSDIKIYEAIANSDIPKTLKSSLYEFYLLGESYIQKIKGITLRIIQIMDDIYSEHSNIEKLLNAHELVSEEAILQTNKLSRHKRWLSNIVDLYVSNSLLSKYLVNRGGEGIKGWMILGLEYDKNFSEEFNTPSQIADFGNALADVVRIKILLRVMEKDEMTLAELAKDLDIINTIVIYHLDVLRKANLIRKRNVGRKVYYWLNRARFDKAGKTLITLYGLGGEKNEKMEEADCSMDE